MATRQITVERFSVISSKSFQAVLSAIEAKIGRPDISRFIREVAASRTEREMEEIVHGAVGSSDLMEFIRFDIGEFCARSSASGLPGVCALSRVTRSS